MLAGLATLMFAAWRTPFGAGTSFCVLCSAAWIADPTAALPSADILIPLAVLEACGWSTMVVAARASEPRQVGRRLLGSWLASSGAIVLGVGLSGVVQTTGAGSALIAAGIAYKAGLVPFFAWAPLLLRHPSPRVSLLGGAAFVAALATLANVVPRLADSRTAAWTILACSVVTVPWALWHAVAQWTIDRRCARSWLVVLAASAAGTAVTMMTLGAR